MGADDVAVEMVDDEAAPLELGFDVVRDCRLAGAREAGEPEDEPAHGATRPMSVEGVWGNREVPPQATKKGARGGNLVSPDGSGPKASDVHVCSPHSVRSVPAQRPSRPLPGCVECVSPIDSYPWSCSLLYGRARSRIYAQQSSSLQSASGLAFQSSCFSSQPSFGASARSGDCSRRIPVIQASRSSRARLSGSILAIAR